MSNWSRTRQPGNLTQTSPPTGLTCYMSLPQFISTAGFERRAFLFSELVSLCHAAIRKGTTRPPKSGLNLIEGLNVRIIA